MMFNLDAKTVALALTEASTGRGRGVHPATGYLKHDAPLLDEMRALVPVVPTLRDAARVVAPRIYQRSTVTAASAVRQIERYFRANFST